MFHPISPLPSEVSARWPHLIEGRMDHASSVSNGRARLCAQVRLEYYPSGLILSAMGGPGERAARDPGGGVLVKLARDPPQAAGKEKVQRPAWQPPGVLPPWPVLSLPGCSGTRGPRGAARGGVLPSASSPSTPASSQGRTACPCSGRAFTSVWKHFVLCTLGNNSPTKQYLPF